MSEEGLVARLSAKTLSKHLLACREYFFLENEFLREYIVDKLSDNFEWYDNALSDQGKEKFKKIPFILTTSDNLCSVINQKLFISTDFKPPKHVKSLSSDYELVEPKNEKEPATIWSHFCYFFIFFLDFAVFTDFAKKS